MIRGKITLQLNSKGVQSVSGVTHVEGDLRLQCVQILEFPLRPQEAPEKYLDVLTIKVRLEIE